MLRDFVAAVLAASTMLASSAAPAFAGSNDTAKTTTPIKHIVIIFQENVSFDHYFATYPVAANGAGDAVIEMESADPSLIGHRCEALVGRSSARLDTD